MIIADEIGVFDSWFDFWLLCCGVVCWACGNGSRSISWFVKWVTGAFWAVDASLLTEVVSEFKVRIFRVWVFLKFWKVLTVVRQLIESAVDTPSEITVVVCIWSNLIS